MSAEQYNRMLYLVRQKPEEYTQEVEDELASLLAIHNPE